MSEKSIILTPNKRLARELQRQFCLESAQQQKSAWNSAKILPLKAWLVEYWLTTPDPKTILSPIQEKIVWQKIISEVLGGKFSSLADLAMEFHELVTNWQINTNNIFQNQTESNTAFQNIYDAFNKFCLSNNLITNSEIASLITPHLKKLNIDQITFAGFDEYSPQLQTLIDMIEKTGCKIVKLDPNNIKAESYKRLSCDGLKQEVTAAAYWAKKIINGNPKNSIGIVVPNLISLRSQVLQIFNEAFGDTKHINISAGIPLKSLPIIELVLNLLSLNKKSNLHLITKIIGSPYILGSETEFYDRSTIKALLNKLPNQQIPLSEIKEYAKKYSKELPIITDTLEKVQYLQESIHKQLLHCSEWIKVFTEILQLFGWPGDNPLTALESSALKHFTQSLQELTTADQLIGKISYQQMLQILHSTILYNTLQPKSEKETPINIFGILEASGINFDHLWVMGVNQDNWPAPPKPNPFIPIAIQKKLELPHSSAERELHFYSNLIARYKRSAKEVIFSFVNQSDDRTVEPSFLIKDIPETTLKELNLISQKTWNEKIFISKQQEQLTDNAGPQLLIDELQHAGSRLIELQSLCPFRAFVEFRLKTKEFLPISNGISKIDHGILLHNALEKFWQQIKTQQKLSQLDPTKLENIINNCVDFSLNKLALSGTAYQLEKQSLILLLTKWLEIEKKRKPFKVVAIEKSLKIELSSIPIKLRIDRIDQLENGKQLLIDYKTGKNIASAFDLFGQRPKSPQLLLYSIVLNSIEALAIAQINTTSIKLKEFSIDELIFTKHKKDNNENHAEPIDWSTLIKYWQNVLTQLATDFRDGKASPTPLSPQICKQCHFSSICRIRTSYL